jgi:putative transposase
LLGDNTFCSARISENIEEFESIEQFNVELDRYMHYYNFERIKEKLKGMRSVQYRTHA